MKYEMERHVLDELLAQHYETGWREGYEQCRQEMTDECDRMVREAERHGGLADVGDRRDEPAARGRHLRMGGPHEVVSVTAEHRRRVTDTSRWHELFGTPERVARVIVHMCDMTDGDFCDACPSDRSVCRCGDYATLLEWLRGDA